MTDRRNAALEKNTKGVCDREAAALIEDVMGEGGGDDEVMKWSNLRTKMRIGRDSTCRQRARSK